MRSNMIELTINRTIDAPRQRVWDVLSDFGGVAKFNPMVQSSEITNGTVSGIGAERRCEFTGRNGHAVERIVNFDGPGRIVIELVRGTMPFNRSYATFNLVERRHDQTDVEMTIEMDPKGGFLGRIMARYMMVPMMRSKLADVLRGLDHYILTGSKLAV